MPRFPSFLPFLLLLTGCAGLQTVVAPVESRASYTGSVHGGQQPVTGASIQLYAVGTTADGSPATPLLATPALTQSNGSFNFSLTTPCPSSGTLVYLAATGGNPGLSAGTTNSAIVALAAVGTCTDLARSTYLSINEATTVAFVNALTPYITSASAVGASSAHSSNIAAGFALATQYVSTLSAKSPGDNLPSGYTAPQAAIYTLSDIVAPCINSTGTDGNCATLFGYTTPSGSPTPTNVLQSLLNIANNPSLNTGNLFSLVSAQSPFQPTLSMAPSSYALALIPSGATGTSTLSPAALTFNDAPVGLPQGIQFLVFTNSTTSAIPAPTLALSGPNKADFTAGPDSSSCNYALPPGSSCTYSVKFVPSATGTRTANFTLTSGYGTYSSTLTGKGVANMDTASLFISGTQTVYAAGTTYNISVFNNGNSPINFSNIAINYTRANYQTFTQTNNCFPQLYSQSVCTIKLTVSGVTSLGGYSSGFLVFTDDLAPGVQSYPINQYPDIGAGYPFYGGYIVGTSSPFTTSSSDSSLYPGISDSTNFNFSYHGCTFAHGNEYCQTSVAFTPKSVGPFTASTNAGSFSTTLSGYGLAPAAYLRFDYPGNASAPFGTTTTLGADVVNYGNASVTMNVPVFTGPDAAAFTLTSSSSSPCVATPPNGCGYLINFTPTHTGDNYATMSITDTTGAFHVTGPVDVVATTSLGTISPSLLTFPDTTSGTTSATMSATVTSTYNLGITASAVSAPYKLVGSSTCASTPCTLSYNFSPVTSYRSGYTSYVSITDTNGNVLGQLTLQGIGNPPPPPPALPAVTLSPTSFNFSSRPVGSTSIAQSGSVQNSGNATLSIASITLTGANSADYILNSSCGATLTAGSSCGYSVSFQPTASGTRTASISIVSNAASSPDTITISGTAQ